MMSVKRTGSGSFISLHRWHDNMGSSAMKPCTETGLTKWSVVCTPKYQGGLRFLYLNIHNRCLLSKWLYKLINEDGVWQNLLGKYLKDRTITQVQYMLGDSHFLACLMKVRDEFLSLESFWLGDGSQIHFSEGLKILYPSIYNIARKMSATGHGNECSLI
jgi:hypothetical protein